MRAIRLLSELFLGEAGVENEPTKVKRRSGLGKLPREPEDEPDSDEDDVPEFGQAPMGGDDAEPELGQDDVDVGDADHDDGGGEEPEPEEPEEEPMGKFASAPQPPRRKSEEETAGLRLSGDPATLASLRDALEQLANSPRVDEDLANWLDECVRAIDQAGRRQEPNVTLPKFEATPDLDDFDDDEGGEPEQEDEGY